MGAGPYSDNVIARTKVSESSSKRQELIALSWLMACVGEQPMSNRSEQMMSNRSEQMMSNR